MLKTVKVEYPNYGSKTYNFLTDISDIKKGDMVVVETTTGSLSIVNVIEVEEGITYPAKRWIVDKIYLDAHKLRIAKTKQLAEVKKKLDAKKKELQDIAICEMLAEKDPEFREILAEYKALTE